MAGNVSGPPFYISVDMNASEPVISYVLPLMQFITIDRHRCYTAKLLQFLAIGDEKMEERNHPYYLSIHNMWKSNYEERHVVQQHRVLCSDMVIPDAACLLANCNQVLQNNIPLLPPAPGIYNHLEFSMSALNYKPIPFSRLIATIEIQECKRT